MSVLLMIYRKIIIFVMMHSYPSLISFFLLLARKGRAGSSVEFLQPTVQRDISQVLLLE